MNIGFLIDPLQSLNLKKDTSLAMIYSAIKQGHTCWYFTSGDLICLSGVVSACLTPLYMDDLNHMPSTGNSQTMPLNCLDCIVMRKDPPFNLEYIYATYALDLAVQQKVLVANKPQSLRDANEKFFTLQFPQCCPPTIVSNNISVLKDFWQAHKEVIFKPLAGMGGSSVLYVDQKGQNLSVILELLTQNGQISIMGQGYIPDIILKGDKRVLMINGEPVPYALARIPAAGELRGNLAAGAQGKVVEINARDREICKILGPVLRDKALYFVGIDIIGDYLTEINVTSPTCAREIMQETGYDITGDYIQFLDALVNKS